MNYYSLRWNIVYFGIIQLCWTSSSGRVENCNAVAVLLSSSSSLIAWLSETRILGWHWPKTLEYCIETLYISKIRRKFCCHFCVVFIIFKDTREIMAIQLKRIHRPRWKCHLYKSSLFVINSWQRKSYFIIIIIIISPK